MIVTPEPWMKQSACRDADPELFFPIRGDNNVEAKAICRRCEVRAECLEYATHTRQQWGTWGGLSAEERTGKHKNRRAS